MDRINLWRTMTMPANKFLIIGQLPPPIIGANVMAEMLMSSLNNLGYEADIVQRIFSKTQVELGQFSFIKILKVPVMAYRIIRQIKRKKPDICIYFISVVLSAFLLDALFIFILRLLGVPYILYCHGKGLKNIGKRNYIWHFVAKKTIGGSIGALVLGERLRNDLTPYLDLQKIYVLPNAAKKEVGGPPKLKDHKLKDNETTQIMFLANLKEDKGPLEFLKMAQEVSKRAPHVRFLLAGPKKHEHFYQKLLEVIKRAELDSVVDLPGGLYNKKKTKAFQESDIFVYPTKNDAFGLVIIEAMQHGLPVISSPEGAIPEIIDNGRNGFIVDPNNISQLTDKVLKLVNDKNLRLKMGMEARKKYEEKYTIDVYQKNLAMAIDYFNKLLSI